MSDLAPDLSLGTEDFSPGYLDTPEPDTLPNGATPNARNAVFARLESQDRVRATMRRRRGSRLINPTPIASGAPVDLMFSFSREDGTSELVVVCNGALYVWDGGTGFAAVTGGSGFTSDADIFAFQFKNNLIVTDGTIWKRYNGTAAFDIGFVAPTAAPALTVGSATGVTGTYEGYAVWVDSVTGHESSPSATSSAVVFTDDKRTWAKPAGAPPANVTHWRVYCRRTDTNEANFYRTGLDQLVATASYTEATSDTARRDAPGPRVSSNDVPDVLAFADEWKSYRIGVKPNSSDLYISKQGDFESQHPDDVFPVGGRGDSKPVRQARKFGEGFYLRKPTKTYQLVGDRVPFTIDHVESSWGAVSQDSGLEVDGTWFDWDEHRGPYASDMAGTWAGLADARVRAIVATVNRTYLHRIRAIHYSPANLIGWMVPTSSARRRTILWYDYTRKRWLPPTTGLEYTAWALHTDVTGYFGMYVGDEWGRVYELFSGDADGPPAGTTVRAPISAATAGTITATVDMDGDPVAFYTTGAGLAGMPVAVKSPAGVWQWVRAQSNTSGVITLDTTNGPQLNPVPAGDGSWEVVVGGIEWYWDTPRLTGGKRSYAKRLWHVFVEGSSTGPNYVLEVKARYNRAEGFSESIAVSFPAAGLVWGVGQWGVDVWGAAGTRHMRKHRMNRTVFDVQLRFQNFYPNQAFEITAYEVTADWRPGRVVKSV